MQLSYPIAEYRTCIERAFCEFLLQIQYASDLPNLQRFKKFLTRIKEGDPNLELPDLCQTGLPTNWCYIQYNRGPLQIVDDDEFRFNKIRYVQTDGTFHEERWGFGQVEMNWWLVGNNGSTIEACEALYYMRIYKLKSLNYCYLDTNWHSRIIHESLGTFEQVDLEDMGTAFSIQWTALLFVPILEKEIDGFAVQEACANIFGQQGIDCMLPIEGYRNETFDLQTSNFLGTVSSRGDSLIHEENFL